MAGSDRDPRLKSAARRRLRADVAAGRIPGPAGPRPRHPPCEHPACRFPWAPIDYGRRTGIPALAYDLDEVRPITLGGDPLDPSNVRPTHAGCNRSAGARLGNLLRGRRRRSNRRRRPALVLDDW